MRGGAWLLALVVGCAPAPEPTVDPGPAPRAQLVSVHDAGAEPRRVLDYRPQARQMVEVDVQVDTRVAIVTDGELRDQSAPPAVFHVEYKVSQVDRSKFNLSARLLRVDGGRAVVRKRAGAIVNILHWTTYDRGGNALEVTVDNTGALGQRLGTLMGDLAQLRPPLPAEPIGQGAHWSVHGPVVIDDVIVAGTTHYELRETSGTVLTIASHTELDPPADDFIPPGAFAGTELDLRQFQGGARATLRIDLARPGWSNSSSKAELRVVYTRPSEDVSPIPHKTAVTITHLATSYDHAR